MHFVYNYTFIEHIKVDNLFLFFQKRLLIKHFKFFTLNFVWLYCLARKVVV